jgi:hypothetical protein
MAAIPTCGGAFFASAPRHYLSSKVIGSALKTHHVHYSAQMQTSRLHFPKGSLHSRHEETSRAASSTSYLQQLSTTKKPLKPLVVCGPSGVGKGKWLCFELCSFKNFMHTYISFFILCCQYQGQ